MYVTNERNSCVLLLVTIRLGEARTTDTDSLKLGRSFFPILFLLCVKQWFFAAFLRTGTVQHSVIFRHFFGPHNKNKGECRSKHNHQEQRSFTCSFSFSNPLSALCQTMLLCCFFFRILELSNILSMLFQNTSLVLTTTTTRENADCRTKNNR